MMNEQNVSCEGFRENLDALLADTLESVEADSLHAHRRSCEACGKFFAEAQSLLSAFDALPSFSPRSYAIENLERSIEAERQGASSDTLWSRLRTHPFYRLTGALAAGIIAAFISTFSFSQVALDIKGLSQTLLVCGLFWVCGYTGIFNLAFRKSLDLKIRNGFNLFHAGERVSSPVLVALAATTIGLLVLAPFGGLQLIFSSPAGAGLDAPSVPYAGWFSLGALLGNTSLVLGANLGNVKRSRSAVIDGVIAGCLFVLMVAPGFAIICVPFTLGLFFTLAAGLVIGALSGGILGFWSVNFLRMRLWRI